MDHPLAVSPECHPLPQDTISIIIPVLNEADLLPATLAAIRTTTTTVANIEIIVVDGGSWDATAQIAATAGATVIATTPGRSHQLNLGASIAKGSILLFLHGDTRLPPNFDRLVRLALVRPGVIAGAFQLKIDQSAVGLRLVEWGVYWRSRLLQMPYGDQAIFLKSAAFHQLGGFADLPFMEDFEFVRQLRRHGKIAIVPAPVFTSGRRWCQLGIFRTTWMNQVAIVAYLLGVSPAKIEQWYRAKWRQLDRQIPSEGNKQR